MTRMSLQHEAAQEPISPRALEPFISVIVPVRNEAAFIEATLDQLLGQDYPADRFEVLVADGQSTDATPAIVRRLQVRHANLRLLANDRRWSSAGRNLGVQAAQGEIIVIVDGHCDLANRSYLRELASAFARSGAACVGRPQPLDVTGAAPVQRAIAAARSSRLGHHPDSYIYSSAEQFVRPQSVAVAYRRWVFGEVGLFDERFDACEDVEFNHRIDRAGLRCFLTPKVQVHYHPRASLAGLFGQMARYGRGRVRLLRKHPDTFTWPGFLPALFLLGVGAGLVLAWASSWAALAYFGVLAFYGLAVVAASVAIALGSRDLRLLPLLPAVFVTIHAGAGFGILQEIVAPSFRRQRHARGETGAKKGTGTGPVSILPMFGGVRAVPVPIFAQPPMTSLPATFPFLKRNPRPGAARGPGVLNALTVDVEDYYHVSAFETCAPRDCWDDYEPRVVGSTAKILDALARASVQGTFFILGWVARRHPGLVRDIHAAGHEIGCHSFWHRLVYHQTPATFRDDLRRGRDLLEHLTAGPVRAYRAPSFSITRRSLWALDILIKEGFAVDSSIYPTHHDRYGIAHAPLRPHRIQRPAGEIWEFPMPVYRRLGYPLPVGGGGYFRLYPYVVTRHGLRTINREGRPFVVYVHPWELDPQQPRLTPGRLRAFRHYVNLHRTEHRLARLLKDFRFGTISAVLAGLNERGTLTVGDLGRAA